MSAILKLRLTAIGKSVGVVLPKEALTRLKLAEGDELCLTESPDGYRLTAYRPEFEEQIALARQVMTERHELLRELAK